MTIVEKFQISSDSDVVYAKITVKNFFKNIKTSGEFLQFAVSEFATNILKYAQKGELWLLQSEGLYLLAALDKGTGIKDIKLAKRRGFSTLENSLGVGLSALDASTEYRLEIFSSTNTKLCGTVAVLVPRKIITSQLFFTMPFHEGSFNGDYFAKKGRFTLFGDSAGHGKKAQNSANEIKHFFLNHAFSTVMIDDFFVQVDNDLRKKELHSTVMSIIEDNHGSYKVCGVGNITLWKPTYVGFQMFMQRKGVVGEVLPTSSKIDIELDVGQMFFMTTDGIENTKIERFLHFADMIPTEPYLLAIVICYFCSYISDDASIFINQYKG